MHCYAIRPDSDSHLSIALLLPTFVGSTLSAEPCCRSEKPLRSVARACFDGSRSASGAFTGVPGNMSSLLIVTEASSADAFVGLCISIMR